MRRRFGSSRPTIKSLLRATRPRSTINTSLRRSCGRYARACATRLIGRWICSVTGMEFCFPMPNTHMARAPPPTGRPSAQMLMQWTQPSRQLSRSAKIHWCQLPLSLPRLPNGSALPRTRHLNRVPVQQMLIKHLLLEHSAVALEGVVGVGDASAG
jgi:hypothetical protein